MDLNEYQLKAMKTANYPNVGKSPVYPALGLAGEAGEISNQTKKIIRDDEGKLTPARADKMAAELGDVLWYVAVLAQELGYTLEAIATKNLVKLDDRQRRGQLGGDGDDR